MHTQRAKAQLTHFKWASTYTHFDSDKWTNDIMYLFQSAFATWIVS